MRGSRDASFEAAVTAHAQKLTALVAAELSIAPGTVKSQAAKALRHLRDETVGTTRCQEGG